MRIDFELSGHGTLYLLPPLTPAAHHRVEEHLPAARDLVVRRGRRRAPLHRADRRRRHRRRTRSAMSTRDPRAVLVLATLLLVGCSAASPTDTNSGISKECSALTALWVKQVYPGAHRDNVYRACIQAKIEARWRSAEVAR